MKAVTRNAGIRPFYNGNGNASTTDAASTASALGAEATATSAAAADPAAKLAAAWDEAPRLLIAKGCNCDLKVRSPMSEE